MPTTRPRFQVTETPGVQRALRAAAAEWPGTSRSELVVRLFQRGAEAIEHGREERREQRLHAIRSTAGSLSDAFGPDYLAELREDWPR